MLYDNSPPSSGVIVSDCTLGNPDDGDFSDGFFTYWNAVYKCSNAFDDINELLLKLLPPKPLDLYMVDLIFENTYHARQESSGNLHVNCTDDTTPRAYAENFYNGDEGTLTCEIDAVQCGSIVLTGGDDTGRNDEYLTIIDDSDPYAGEAGKEGFWKQISAEIIPNSPLSFSNHIYNMIHSQSGLTQNNIWVDNPQNATINSIAIVLPSQCNRWISGVPSLQINDMIVYSANLNNAVGKHYHIDYVSRVYSLYTSADYYDPTSPPNEGDIININGDVNINNHVYTENLSLTFVPYNSKQACSSVQHDTNARVDTVSNEIRVRSGLGQFPNFGTNDDDFGDVYDSTISLKTSPYITELQLLNGKYQIPHGNYSLNLPTQGPDYSSGMGNDMRWVTFQTIVIDNKSGLNINFNSVAGTWNGIETEGIEIYVKVEGDTGWLNGNKAYPGVGSPTNDNDYAMVYSMSTATSKRITFGSIVRTGVVYVRIGLPMNSNKQFKDITVHEV